MSSTKSAPSPQAFTSFSIIHIPARKPEASSKETFAQANTLTRSNAEAAGTHKGPEKLQSKFYPQGHLVTVIWVGNHSFGLCFSASSWRSRQKREEVKLYSTMICHHQEQQRVPGFCPCWAPSLGTWEEAPGAAHVSPPPHPNPHPNQGFQNSLCCFSLESKLGEKDGELAGDRTDIMLRSVLFL